jgi:hypothetical protein
VWYANPLAIEVDPGDTVVFDPQGRPAKLWFPDATYVDHGGPIDMSDGQPRPVVINKRAPRGAKIYYLMYLLDEHELLMGCSPPYIKIKEPPKDSGNG